MPILHAKSWNIKISTENGITYYQASGNVPATVKAAIAQLSKTPVNATTATNILKTQFSQAITKVEQ